jgi:hypothetical protein
MKCPDRPGILEAVHLGCSFEHHLGFIKVSRDSSNVGT